MLRLNSYTKIGSLLLTCLLLFSFAQAQQSSNPFEIKHRLKEISPSSSEAERNPFELPHREKTLEKEDSASIAAPAVTKNPFEARPDQLPEATENVAKTNPFDVRRGKSTEQTVISPAPTKEIVEPLPESANSSNFLFWTLLVMMVLFTLALTLYRSLFVKAYRAFTNDNVLKLLHREQGAFLSFPYLVLYLLFFINAGIFIFLIARFFGDLPDQFMMLLYIILGVALAFLAKHILLKVIEYTFPVAKEIRQYSFTIIIFSIVLGVVLIPFNIMLAYAPPAFVPIAAYGGLLVLLLLYLFRSLRGLFIASKYLAVHKFHFFMYLCTVEIAPVLIMVKILLLNTGIQ